MRWLGHWHVIWWLNSLRPRQDGRHFPDAIFKWIFLNENVWISITVSLEFIPKGPINNVPSLVQIMAWRQSGDKPLSEPLMVDFFMHMSLYINELTHWPLLDLVVILKLVVFKLISRSVFGAFPVKLPSGECHKTSLWIGQHWFREWLGAIRQQSITWTNPDLQVLWQHLALPGHEELTHWGQSQNGCLCSRQHFLINVLVWKLLRLN